MLVLAIYFDYVLSTGSILGHDRGVNSLSQSPISRKLKDKVGIPGRLEYTQIRNRVPYIPI